MALLSSSLDFARDWAECALNIAFPPQESVEPAPQQIAAPYCRQCGDPYPALAALNDDFVCNHCSDRKWDFLWGRAAYRTTGQVREAIVGFKYHEEYYRQAQLVDWLTDGFDRHANAIKWHGLVPVPLYHRRHRERGFNQAYEIAAGLSTRRRIPISDCLYRYRETVSQTKLERNARWENMAGAFRMKRGFDVKSLNLLLIDDVFTTGATVNACAQALRKAGAGQLAVLTIARS